MCKELWRAGLGCWELVRVETLFRIELLLGVKLRFDAGDALVDDGNRFHPGFEDFGGVACVEGARMRQFGGIIAFRFFESLLKVGEALFEIFLAHWLKVHRACVMRTGFRSSDHPFEVAGQGDFAKPRKAGVPRLAAFQVECASETGWGERGVQPKYAEERYLSLLALE